MCQLDQWMNASGNQKGLDLGFIKGSATVEANDRTQEEGNLSCAWNPGNHSTRARWDKREIRFHEGG